MVSVLGVADVVEGVWVIPGATMQRARSMRGYNWSGSLVMV